MTPSTVHRNENGLSKTSRRPPAHLSVSLRHEGTSQMQDRLKVQNPYPSKQTPTNTSSGSNDNTSSSSRVHSSQRWFDKTNENPRISFSQALDDEPPYFLPQASVQSSDAGDGRRRLHPAKQTAHLHDISQSYDATETSHVEDFRGVIDDLTIENKKLKERLRRMGNNHSPHLENERLFEVTIHGLSANKRRKLEEKLREFTTTLEDSSSSDIGGSPPKVSRRHHIDPHAGQKRSDASSNDIARPPDSAYASMSNDPQNSSSHLSSNNTNSQQRIGFEKRRDENVDTIQTFLQGIPEGLLPRGNLALSDRQKQRIVVRRLEQLFTGKQGLALLDNQLAQQQEVADSAARADDVSMNAASAKRGLREAHMLPQSDLRPRPGNLATNQSRDDILINPDESSDVMDFEQEQRPTRPLDLDPDRAQVAADNVEYIRHLGLSTPQLLSEDSSDAESDAQGWVYLNLLINMAQLHIINVTPDFVRRAVQEVSQKLQLSQDGHKLRWRGGSKGTKLSSADDGSTESTEESEDVNVTEPKRRRANNGRFATIPVNTGRAKAVSGLADNSNFHYRPMFNHHSSSTESSYNSWSGTSNVYDKSFAAALDKVVNSSEAERSQTNNRPKRRRGDGTMVFYSKAQFCTDLAGDRKVPTPVYLEPGEERDLAMKHVLGAEDHNKKSWQSQSRTSSIKSKSILDVESQQLKQSDASDISIYDGAPDSREQSPPKALQEFTACGLGGTQPADHFVVRIHTHRTHNPRARRHLSSSSKMKKRSVLHKLQTRSLTAFTDSVKMSHEEHLAADMASLSASSPPASEDDAEMPIEVQYISARFTRLEPSQLPEPMGYYAMSTSDDDDDDDLNSSETKSSISRPKNQTINQSRTTTTGAAQSRARIFSEMDYDCEEDESEEDDYNDDDDMSIDMLGHLRKIAPLVVAAREESFDLRNAGVDGEMTASAAATVAESVDES